MEVLEKGESDWFILYFILNNRSTVITRERERERQTDRQTDRQTETMLTSNR